MLFNMRWSKREYAIYEGYVNENPLCVSLECGLILSMEFLSKEVEKNQYCMEEFGCFSLVKEYLFKLLARFVFHKSKED